MTIHFTNWKMNISFIKSEKVMKEYLHKGFLIIFLLKGSGEA